MYITNLNYLRVKLYYAIFCTETQWHWGDKMKKKGASHKKTKQLEREESLYKEFLKQPANSFWLVAAHLLVLQHFHTNKRKKLTATERMRLKYAQKIGKRILTHFPPSKHSLNRNVLETIAIIESGLKAKKAKNILQQADDAFD